MWPNPQENASLIIFTAEILNRKLHFLYSDAFATVALSFLSDNVTLFTSRKP